MYYHGKLLKKKSTEEVKKLLAEGKTDEVILSYMPLVISLANRYPRQFEDMVSVGTIALIRFIRNMPEEHTNPGAGVNVSVRQGMKQFFIEDHVVRKKRGAKGINPVTSVYEEELPEETEQKVYKLLGGYKDPLAKMNVKEVMGHKIFTQIEKDFMRLKMEGYQDKEIAKQLGTYPMVISRLRSDIRGRVLYILKGEF